MLRESLAEIRNVIEVLVQKRDSRKDSFAKVVAKSLETTYGRDAEDAEKLLSQAGFTQKFAKQAVEVARKKGRFSIWSVVEALTELTRDYTFAASRTEVDRQASSLLDLVAA